MYVATAIWRSSRSFLLSDRRINPCKPDNNGWAPFHCACGNNHLEIVELILSDPRINPCESDNEGWSPLYCACGNGHLEIVKLVNEAIMN